LLSSWPCPARLWRLLTPKLGSRQRRAGHTGSPNNYDETGAQGLRSSVVAPARRSPEVRRKAAGKRTAEGLTAYSFQMLLADLATIAKNHARFWRGECI